MRGTIRPIWLTLSSVPGSQIDEEFHSRLVYLSAHVDQMVMGRYFPRDLEELEASLKGLINRVPSNDGAVISLTCDIALALNAFALVYLSRGQFSQSLELLQKAERLSESADGVQSSLRFELRVLTLDNLALYFYWRGKFSASLQYVSRALQLSRKVRCRVVGKCYVHLGCVLSKLSRYNEAVKAFQDAIHYFRASDEEECAEEAAQAQRAKLSEGKDESHGHSFKSYSNEREDPIFWVLAGPDKIVGLPASPPPLPAVPPDAAPSGALPTGAKVEAHPSFGQQSSPAQTLPATSQTADPACGEGSTAIEVSVSLELESTRVPEAKQELRSVAVRNAIATCENNLAVQYILMYHYGKAKSHAQKAVAIATAVPDLVHPWALTQIQKTCLLAHTLGATSRRGEDPPASSGNR